jgi:S1-C subfamily serine protease
MKGSFRLTGRLLAASLAAAATLLVPATAIGAAVPNAVAREELSGDAIAARSDSAIVDVITRTTNGEAAGTGIVLTSNGEILTNYHVVEGSTSINVTISNASQRFSAKVVGTDRADDVALLQAKNANGLKTIALGKSAGVSVGDRVIAIGNAFNRPGKPTVTEGTVSALGRSITVFGDFGAAEQLSDLIQTDAQIAPGNSGGPLFNSAGEVIGVNTAAETGRRLTAGSGSGYAIPIDDAMKVVRQIESGRSRGNVHVGPRAVLGVNIRDGDQGFGSGSMSGVLVVGVSPGSGAESAGIVRGDQIVAVDGTNVGSVRALTKVMNVHKPGERMSVVWVDQAGQRHHATARLQASPTA